MRSQESRDEQTVAIATALGVFALVMVVAIVAVLITVSTFDAVEGYADAIIGAGALLGGVLAVRSLHRAEHR